MTSYDTLLHYNQERGTLRVREYDAVHDEEAWSEYTSVDEVASALSRIQNDILRAYVAGYGLTLAAYHHQDWPTEAQRGVLIQAAEALRTAHPMSEAVHVLLDEALQVANGVLLRGDKAEPALADFVAAQVAQPRDG